MIIPIRAPASGQLQRERRTFAELRSNLQLVTEQVHDPVHDAEAESISFARGVGGHCDLEELIVDMRERIAWDPDARIEDFQTHEGLIVQASQLHEAVPRVLDRVRYQISQHLFDERWVGLHAARTRLHVQLQALFRSQARKLIAQLGKNLGDGEIGHFRLDDAGFELADVEERVQETRHRTNRVLLLHQSVGGLGLFHHPAQRSIEQRECLQPTVRDWQLPSGPVSRRESQPRKLRLFM